MAVRFARADELDRVNELRRQVNELHAEALPEVFKQGFQKELRDHVYTVFADPRQRIIVNERGGELCGFAVINHITKPENPFMFERDFLDIDEFCVDAAKRREGVGTELMEFIRQLAAEEGFTRIELNMWEFNSDALEFYEAMGFRTYRRYLQAEVDPR